MTRLQIELCRDQCCEDVEHAALVAREAIEDAGIDLWFEGRKLMRRGADGRAYPMLSINMKALLSRCIEFRCRGKTIDPPPKVVSRLLLNSIGQRMFRQNETARQGS